MIIIDPKKNEYLSVDENMQNIIQTHSAYMNVFSDDTDMRYSILIVQCKEDISTVAEEEIDYVNINGKYYEANIISDDEIKVAIIPVEIADNRITDLLDEFS